MRSVSAFAPLVVLMAVILLGASAAYFKRSIRPGAGGIHSTTGDFPGKILTAADGTRVLLERPAERVVALSLAADEIIVELAGADRLRGVSQFSRDPRLSNISDAVASVKETIVGTNAEQILRVGPDLVLVTSYSSPRARAKLERLGLRVFPLPDFKDFASIRVAIGLLGEILDARTRSTALLLDVDRRLESIRKKLPVGPRPTVLSLDPGDFWVAGSETIIGEMIELAGGENIARREGIQGFRKLNAERLIRWDPDWLLLEGEASDQARLVERFRENPMLSLLSAVRKGGLILIPAKKLSSVSHHAVDAVEILFENIHGSPASG